MPAHAAPRAALLFALAAVGLGGCDPPCKPYWQERCRSCGADSPACEHAKLAAKHELADEAQCAKLTKRLGESSEFSKSRYCEMHIGGARNLDELKGPWRCGPFKVDFLGPSQESGSSANPQKLAVDDHTVDIHNVQHAMFQVQGAPACNYWMLPHEHSDGERALALLCPESVIGLPKDELIHCKREKP